MGRLSSSQTDDVTQGVQTAVTLLLKEPVKEAVREALAEELSDSATEDGSGPEAETATGETEESTGSDRGFFRFTTILPLVGLAVVAVFAFRRRQGEDTESAFTEETDQSDTSTGDEPDAKPSAEEGGEASPAP